MYKVHDGWKESKDLSVVAYSIGDVLFVLDVDGRRYCVPVSDMYASNGDYRVLCDLDEFTLLMGRIERLNVAEKMLMGRLDIFGYFDIKSFVYVGEKPEDGIRKILMDGDVPKEFAIEIWQRGGSLLKRCEELVLIQEQMCISTADAVTLRYHFGRPRTEWND
jgi:hypothetical protein